MDKLFEYYQEKGSKMTAEEFSGIFRSDFQGKVYAKVDVIAERTMAEEIARSRMEIAVDVMKIFGLSQHDTRDVRIFDLNYKVNMPQKTVFLQKDKATEMEYMVNLNFENSFHFQFPAPIADLAQQNGLGLMSDFIRKEFDDELYSLIVNGIRIYSSALSMADLHLRAIMIMTLLESLLLHDNDTAQMTLKTKVRLSKLLSGNSTERTNITDLFNGIYQIRHKMVHKAIRLPIDHDKYNEAQMRLVHFLLELVVIYNTGGITDKPSLIAHIDARP